MNIAFLSRGSSLRGRLKVHQAVRVGTDIGYANVIAPDDDNVRSLLLLRRSRRRRHSRGENRGEQTGQKFSEDRATHGFSLPETPKPD
jgi:hypothetical protein